MSESALRSIFFVLAPPGQSATAMSYSVPVNQPLHAVLQIMLALPGAFQEAGAWGSPAAYRLHDLYSQALDPGILVRQVPFPGCVIAVSAESRVSAGGKVLDGDEAVAMLTHSIAMSLFAQREDPDDPVTRRYLKYLASGAWRFDPTPITGADIGLSYHQADEEPATRLLERLSARGLRCRVRCVGAAGAPAGDGGEPRSPAEDARALAVVISPDTQHDPWIAYDVGVAWAAGIPVVPVLVGTWTSPPPDILSPYQRIVWETQQDRAVGELLDLLDLTPWCLPVSEPKPAAKRARRRADAPRRR